jgi:hypothetical protein
MLCHCMNINFFLKSVIIEFFVLINDNMYLVYFKRGLKKRSKAVNEFLLAHITNREKIVEGP